MTIQDYYGQTFSEDLQGFMPNSRVPYFGHNWPSQCQDLEKVTTKNRAGFIVCLYFTVLIDQAMYTYFNSHYGRFAALTKYPKFCFGLGQFQKNPRLLLSGPIECGMVSKAKLLPLLKPGMELFVDEVIDFFSGQMADLSAAELFQKLVYDPDVQIPLLVVMIDPDIKNDIIWKSYDALVKAVAAKFPFAKKV